MADTPRPLIAGNWKMNGLAASLSELDAVVAAAAAGKAGPAELLVCPPATLLDRAAQRGLGEGAGHGVALGGQDCHAEASGAHTGDLSAEMLRDAGASYVIVGHSERRTDHGETDAVVRGKAAAARRAGLVPVLCIGETRSQRDAGHTLDVLGTQLAGSMPDGLGPDSLVVAYEPVWAIGTGLTPTIGDVDEVHTFLRDRLVGAMGEGGRLVRILYGGSVKPGNAADLLAIRHVDGALVGGASLRATDFLAIAAGCP